MSDTNPINQSVGSMDSTGTQEKDGMMDGIDTIDETIAYMALIRKNLEYEHHMKYDQYGDKEMYEEIYETVCDITHISIIIVGLIIFSLAIISIIRGNFFYLLKFSLFTCRSKIFFPLQVSFFYFLR